MPKSRKRCSRCNRNRLVKFFWKNSSKADGLQSVCVDCKKGEFADYYRQNRDRHRESVYRRREVVRNKAREMILLHLQQHPCVDCGETDPLILQFDHVREEKVKGISEMVSEGCALATISREIDKCEVRCAHCHIRKTSAEQRSWMWRRLQEITEV